MARSPKNSAPSAGSRANPRADEAGVTAVPAAVHKGRGAIGNAAGRFEAYQTVAVDDGWAAAGHDSLPPRTTLAVDASRGIVARNASPDVPFDRSVNPYRGCEHGCVYCFARPSHAYLGLSPGLDFETRLFAKPAAPALLDAAFRKPAYRPQVMALGSNTDCYQPVERHQNITRGLLAVFQRFGHPVAIITKSDLITRDLDILTDLAARRLVAVNISVTTLDRELARRLEPRAPTPAKRLAAVAALAAAGVPVNLLMAPIIPGLTDHEIERVVAAGADAGATSTGYVLLRLPRELQGLFAAWLECHAPARADRVLNLIRDTRGGALYRSDWGRHMRGDGPVADLIAQRFHKARARHGLVARRYDLALDQFAVPADDGRQMALF